ncbi:MAG: SIMPL domain-containing protein [Hyphomicrobiales bacterium]|nr:SIMPL domain-containing protein [Hyphomicrobiales bacterium]
MRCFVIAFTAALAAVALGGANAMAETADKPVARTIRLDATGSVAAKPDMARITLGVAAEADTARAALDQNSAAMARVVEALKAAGLGEDDIQTVDFTVRPRYETNKGDGRNLLVGYRVLNLVRIGVRQIARLGEVLDKAVAQGSNEMGGIEFTLVDPTALLDEARRRAMASAKDKAELYAAAAGARLGRVLSIDETSAQPWRSRAMAATRLDAKAFDAPIQPGEAELQVNVSVLWELIDPIKP